MFEEIDKFNKLKRQKQKEAKLLYDDEVKKIINDEINERKIGQTSIK